VSRRDEGTIIRGKTVNRLGEHLLQRAKHQGERGPEFMADVREKNRFCAIQFRECFSPPPLIFIRFGIADHSRNLTGNKIEKTAVIVVK
jgi:hypothetical protein